MTADASEMITVPSRLFGPIQVPRSSLITFPDGMPGFAGLRQFIVVPAAADGLYWLQDCSDAGIIFLLGEPNRFVEGYDPRLDLPESEEIGVLGIITLPTPGESATMNLQGPLIIDFASRMGEQVVLEPGAWSTRHEVDLQALLAAS